MKSICEAFPISEREYKSLEVEFSNLTRFASWQLIKKNTKNNHTDEFDDINQELLMAMLRAGSYYKRQIYIEQSLSVVKKYAKDNFMLFVLHELEELWNNRTRHGANKQKFGYWQEMLLEKMVQSCVPKKYHPQKDQILKMDPKFATYCKAIVWNAQKSMGRKITREKSIRSSMASLSEYEHISGMVKL